MTFSNKFGSLDSREAALLDDLSGEGREIFEKLCADYEADFRPENEIERDSVYCLATLRWGIDRLRLAIDTTAEAFDLHGYVPPKIKAGLDELRSYERELQIRYEYFFSTLYRWQNTRLAA
jgi:hypothetical protein